MQTHTTLFLSSGATLNVTRGFVGNHDRLKRTGRGGGGGDKVRHSVGVFTKKCSSGLTEEKASNFWPSDTNATPLVTLFPRLGFSEQNKREGKKTCPSPGMQMWFSSLFLVYLWYPRYSSYIGPETHWFWSQSAAFPETGLRGPPRGDTVGTLNIKMWAVRWREVSLRSSLVCGRRAGRDVGGRLGLVSFLLLSPKKSSSFADVFLGENALKQ